MAQDPEPQTQVEKARSALQSHDSQSMQSWLDRHGSFQCRGVRYSLTIDQFTEPPEGLGRALYDGRPFRATARLHLKWDHAERAIPVYLPWADENDRFGWEGRTRVFVRQFRFAPGPHVSHDANDAGQVVRSHLHMRPLFGRHFHICLDRKTGLRYGRVGSPLRASELDEDLRLLGAEDLLERYCTAIEADKHGPSITAAQKAAPHQKTRWATYFLSPLGQLRTNRFLGLDDSCGNEEQLKPEQITKIFEWNGFSSGRLPVEERCHLANYHVREFHGFLREQASRLVSHLRVQCARIDKEGTSSPEEVARVLLSQNALYWFENAARDEEQFQVLDDLNPLTARAHTRRITFMGSGGPGAQVRASIAEHQSHESHLGRICPVDTPQGPRIGLNVFLAVDARVNDRGQITCPLEDGGGNVHHLDVFEQRNSQIVVGDDLNSLPPAFVSTGEELKVEFRPKPFLLRPRHIVSECTAQIPFLQHDDNNRALLGTNFLKQAIPLAPRQGEPRVYNVDAPHLVLPAIPRGWPDDCTAPFVNSHHLAYPGGDPPQWSLGRDIWVVMMPWFGWNFEDGIVVSEELVQEGLFAHTEVRLFALDLHTHQHIFPLPVPQRRGFESGKLDQDGLIAIGTNVAAGDTLVIYGKKGASAQPKPVRWIVPYGVQGNVAAVKVLTAGKDAVLAAGVDTRILVWVRQNWPLEIGDKLANRHGGKGVICHIEAADRMPTFTINDQKVRAQVVLNPFGVLGRKNLGQLAENACGILPDPTPVRLFGGPAPQEITQRLQEHRLNDLVSVRFRDCQGRERVMDDVAVGRQFISKLDHSPHKKLHARGIGPGYNLVTGQPLGGRRRRGGQRLGEMEVWALLAHQAINTFLELAAVKSDAMPSGLRTPEAMEREIRNVAGRSQYYSETLHALWAQFYAAGLDLVLSDASGERITWLQLMGTDLNQQPSPVASLKLQQIEWGAFQTLKPLDIAVCIPLDSRSYREALQGRMPSARERHVLSCELMSDNDRWGRIDLRGLGVIHPLLGDGYELEFLPVLPWRFRSYREDVIRAFASGRPQNWLNRAYDRVFACCSSIPGPDDPERPAAQQRLQRAVDTLLGVNSATGTSRKGKNEGILERLVGKKGFIRSECLRRRVDCSARAVISVDPQLEPDEVCIPLEVAAALLEPLPEDLAPILASYPAGGFPDATEQREALCEAINSYLGKCQPPLHLLLNRQPSLHRLSVQAFRFRCWKGRTIRIPPYCTGGLGADFDGDTVAVYLPKSEEAQRELREKLSPLAQVLSPANGACAWSISAEVSTALNLAKYDLKTELVNAHGQRDALKRATMNALPHWQEALASSLLSFNCAQIACSPSADEAQQSPVLKQFLVGKVRKSVQEMFAPGQSDGSCLAKGLSGLDFHAAEQAARRGLMDKAFTTAPAGYITRQLIYLLANLRITQADCGDGDGIVLDLDAQQKAAANPDLLERMLVDSMDVIESARTDPAANPSGNARRPLTGKLRIRSPLSCKAHEGVCQRCYGWDLARQAAPQFGLPIGLIAAQSIGERGTQMAMKTFHSSSATGMGASLASLQAILRHPSRNLPTDPGTALAFLTGMLRCEVHLKHFAVMLRGLTFGSATSDVRLDERLRNRGLLWMAASFERQMEGIAALAKIGDPVELCTPLDFAAMMCHNSRPKQQAGGPDAP